MSWQQFFESAPGCQHCTLGSPSCNLVQALQVVLCGPRRSVVLLEMTAARATLGSAYPTLQLELTLCLPTSQLTVDGRDGACDDSAPN